MNTEKEWFEDMISWPERGATHNEVKDILRAQKERDWEEFRGMVEVGERDPSSEYTEGWIDASNDVLRMIDAKLTELNKPKE